MTETLEVGFTHDFVDDRDWFVLLVSENLVTLVVGQRDLPVVEITSRPLGLGDDVGNAFRKLRSMRILSWLIPLVAVFSLSKYVDVLNRPTVGLDFDMDGRFRHILRLSAALVF